MEEASRLVAEGMTVLAENYVDPQRVQPRALISGAMSGLTQPDVLDKHCGWHPPLENQALHEELRGEHVGIGVLCIPDPLGIRLHGIFPDSPASQAGLRIDDVITYHDGRELAGRDYVSSVADLKGPRGSQIELTVLRGDRSMRISVKRGYYSVPSIFGSWLEKGVGYLRFEIFSQHSAEELNREASSLVERGARLLIIDLRDNGGGMLDAAERAANLFLPAGATVVSIARRGVPPEKIRCPAQGAFVGLPMIILVDANSASASEIFSGAMRDNRCALLVGSKTYGKASVQTVNTLSDGSALRFTIAKYRTPSGEDIHGKGLQPDVRVVTPDADARDILASLRYCGEPALHDPVLAAAKRLGAEILADGMEAVRRKHAGSEAAYE
ncbi:MAG: Periplasmic protease [Verrucomicrobiota bacterium]|jgi:carboxyl-terminal processing protease